MTTTYPISQTQRALLVHAQERAEAAARAYTELLSVMLAAHDVTSGQAQVTDAGIVVEVPDAPPQPDSAPPE